MFCVTLMLDRFTAHGGGRVKLEVGRREIELGTARSYQVKLTASAAPPLFKSSAALFRASSPDGAHIAVSCADIRRVETSRATVVCDGPVGCVKAEGGEVRTRRAHTAVVNSGDLLCADVTALTHNSTAIQRTLGRVYGVESFKSGAPSAAFFLTVEWTEIPYEPPQESRLDPRLAIDQTMLRLSCSERRRAVEITPRAGAPLISLIAVESCCVWATECGSIVANGGVVSVAGSVASAFVNLGTVEICAGRVRGTAEQ